MPKETQSNLNRKNGTIAKFVYNKDTAACIAIITFLKRLLVSPNVEFINNRISLSKPFDLVCLAVLQMPYVECRSMSSSNLAGRCSGNVAEQGHFSSKFNIIHW